MSKTVIYAAEVQRDGETVHVLGYQNKVKASKEPNAMILPIPAVGPIGPANIIDSRSFRGILDSYDRAVERLRPQSRGLKGIMRGEGSHDGVQVFESGSYTIALAERPSLMRVALEHLPEDRRPHIPGSFLASFHQLYPDWPIAICCFDGTLEAPEPLLWWYKPRSTTTLFAPAIDAHDGGPPDLGAMVERDHKLAFGSYRSTRRPDGQLREEIQGVVPAEHQWMFTTSVVGSKLQRMTRNGDFVLPISAVTNAAAPPFLTNPEIATPNN